MRGFIILSVFYTISVLQELLAEFKLNESGIHNGELIGKNNQGYQHRERDKTVFTDFHVSEAITYD